MPVLLGIGACVMLLSGLVYVLELYFIFEWGGCYQQNKIRDARLAFNLALDRAAGMNGTSLAAANFSAVTPGPACPGCERKACAKMAGYLRHAASCTQGAACLDCRRIDTLVQLHARRCTLDLCRVPGCVSLRERLRVESWKAALEG